MDDDDWDMSLPGLDEWQTSADYARDGLEISTAKFFDVTNLLLENPNLNSSHLFRADILFDSAGILKTAAQTEKQCCGHQAEVQEEANDDDEQSAYEKYFYVTFNGSSLERVVVRRLIPRNLNLDRPLDQTCLIFKDDEGDSIISYAVIYIPHAENETEIPWYHPPVHALGYFYQRDPIRTQSIDGQAELSLHFLPFHDGSCKIPDRLNRTFISLLNTFIRLSKHPSPTSNDVSESDISTAPSALKDTIIPQHIVQNTYSRLKQTYAADLIARWVESTEPSKHVFEDLSIAAFLIELWKMMYHEKSFPGFVDIACGNGVLVYVLLKEAYHGWGFDARRRKTWDILGIDEHLEERICIPHPFLTALELSADDALPDIKVHSGIFPPDTFIISNHADELTPWTPLLATLSSPQSPLPFLSIPCCSHALSGAKHRYTPKDYSPQPSPSNSSSTLHPAPAPSTNALSDAEPQPRSGSFKSLRAQKVAAATHTDDKSMYACLTKKVVALGEEVGFDSVEMTLMRIPSTRNIGVVGGRKRISVLKGAEGSAGEGEVGVVEVQEKMEGLALQQRDQDVGGGQKMAKKVQQVIERECRISGGVEASAKMWVERAKKLQTGRGRGKVNLGYKPQS